MPERDGVSVVHVIGDRLLETQMDGHNDVCALYERMGCMRTNLVRIDFPCAQPLGSSVRDPPV